MKNAIKDVLCIIDATYVVVRENIEGNGASDLDIATLEVSCDVVLAAMCGCILTSEQTIEFRKRLRSLLALPVEE